MNPTIEDANLILRLYELRRETKMREARAWFLPKFTPQTIEEFEQLCPFGGDENTFYRMVATYWEMVASFLNSGVLNRELFYKSGNELLFVYLRISRLLPEMRTRYSDSSIYGELEEAATGMIAWKQAHSPDGYETFRKRVQGS